MKHPSTRLLLALPLALLAAAAQAAPPAARPRPSRPRPPRADVVAGYYLCTRLGGTELDSLRLDADGDYLAERLVKTTGSSYTQTGQYLVRGHEIFLHFTSTGRAKWTGRTIQTTFTITSDPHVVSDGVLKTYIKQARVGSVFP